ncbi:DNA alkylation repair protein [Actinomadura scrupuli]|uniref:DNA alkylation repair protein n=1 Tax=Actinomadura scrupuli TaxID=559629 RepID=UPI003D989064
MDVEGALRHVESELRALADPARATSERSYLKSDLVHLGVPLPAIRKIANGAVRREPSRADLLALADGLWAATDGGVPVHELRMAAIEVLSRRVTLLEAGDLSFAERLIRDSRSWAYVDGIAVKIVGGLLTGTPALGGVLDRWAGDANFWIRRTALLALLPGIRAGRGDLDRLARYGDALIEEREFFIRKALGWVLRELAVRDPEWVIAWVAPRVKVISGVTMREAVRRLPEADAARLLESYRSR